MTRRTIPGRDRLWHRLWWASRTALLSCVATWN